MILYLVVVKYRMDRIIIAVYLVKFDFLNYLIYFLY